MKILGVLLLIGGLFSGALGIWRKMNPGGPVFFGGDVSDSIKDLYGVTESSKLPIIIGVVLLIIGLILLIVV
jgi:hypothetical protein